MVWKSRVPGLPGRDIFSKSALSRELSEYIWVVGVIFRSRGVMAQKPGFPGYL